MKQLPPDQISAAKDIAEGSKYIWRDVLSLIGMGKLIELHNYGAIVSQYNLDILGDQPGMIVIRTLLEWIALAIGEENEVLTVVDGLPAWRAVATDIELTGDVVAGPGPSPLTTALSETGVVAGAYTLANVLIGEDGRIYAAEDGSAAGTGTIPHPGYVTGRYYTTKIEGIITNASQLANTIHAVPFYVAYATTFTKMAVFQPVAGTVNIELGVYSNNNGVPDQLVHDAGSITITSGTGIREITGRTITLNPGWYWLAVGMSATATFRCTPSNMTALADIMGLGSGIASTAAFAGVTASWAFSAGNFPTTFPTPTPTTSTVTLPWIGK